MNGKRTSQIEEAVVATLSYASLREGVTRLPLDLVGALLRRLSTEHPLLYPPAHLAKLGPFVGEGGLWRIRLDATTNPRRPALEISQVDARWNIQELAQERGGELCLHRYLAPAASLKRHLAVLLSAEAADAT